MSRTFAEGSSQVLRYEFRDLNCPGLTVITVPVPSMGVQDWEAEDTSENFLPGDAYKKLCVFIICLKRILGCMEGLLLIHDP